MRLIIREDYDEVSNYVGMFMPFKLSVAILHTERMWVWF